MSTHIMVFDDDQAMQDMFVVLLQDAGYKVTIHRAPTVTVQEIEKLAPDLIMLDWVHGREKRGMHLIERLANHKPTAMIPIVACSVETPFRNDPEVCDAYLNIGMVRKPFELDDLMSTIAHQLSA